MKKILFAAFAALLLSAAPSTTKAQDPGTVILVVGEGIKITKKTYNAISYVASNWTKIKWYFKGVFFGFKHTWWYVTYEDGFTTYNNFRSHRTPDDAYNYFVLGHGDCDARYFHTDGQTLLPICYTSPDKAKRYTDNHGPIVDIGFQQNGKNISLGDINY
jgi:hypothetical protein